MCVGVRGTGAGTSKGRRGWGSTVQYLLVGEGQVLPDVFVVAQGRGAFVVKETPRLFGHGDCLCV